MGFGAAAGIGLLGDLINYEVNAWDRWEQNNKMTEADLQEYMKNVDLNNSMAMLKAQQDYNTQMANSAYQRAVVDMEKAGLNPASMSGVNAQAAASPTANASYHSSAVNASADKLFSDKAFSSLATSGLLAMLSKDKQAAKYLADEFIDNAKHAHRIEELQERYSLAGALKKDEQAWKMYHDYYKNREHEWKSNYYEEIVEAMRAKK